MAAADLRVDADGTPTVVVEDLHVVYRVHGRAPKGNAVDALKRPIKWIETRSENMATSHHGRDQISRVRMGATRDGTLTGLHVEITADLGRNPVTILPDDGSSATSRSYPLVPLTLWNLPPT